MNETGMKQSNGIILDDMKVLYPDTEVYETEDKETLIARLKDKDNLIKRLWFELKNTREQVQKLNDYTVHS